MEDKKLDGEEHWCIHRDPPPFEDQSPVAEILETGIKVIDLLAPYSKGRKSRSVWRRGRRKNSPDSGADPEYCDGAGRLFYLYGCR